MTSLIVRGFNDSETLVLTSPIHKVEPTEGLTKYLQDPQAANPDSNIRFRACQNYFAHGYCSDGNACPNLHIPRTAHITEVHLNTKPPQPYDRLASGARIVVKDVVQQVYDMFCSEDLFNTRGTVQFVEQWSSTGHPPAFKLKRCNNFEANGSCPFGQDCNYVHVAGTGSRCSPNAICHMNSKAQPQQAARMMKPSGEDRGKMPINSSMQAMPSSTTVLPLPTFFLPEGTTTSTAATAGGPVFQQSLPHFFTPSLVPTMVAYQPMFIPQAQASTATTTFMGSSTSSNNSSVAPAAPSQPQHPATQPQGYSSTSNGSSKKAPTAFTAAKTVNKPSGAPQPQNAQQIVPSFFMPQPLHDLASLSTTQQHQQQQPMFTTPAGVMMSGMMSLAPPQPNLMTYSPASSISSNALSLSLSNSGAATATAAATSYQLLVDQQGRVIGAIPSISNQQQQQQQPQYQINSFY